MLGLLIISAFCAIMGTYSLLTGTLIMKGKYEKELRPFTYWFGTVTYYLMAIASIVAALVKHSQEVPN